MLILSSKISAKQLKELSKRHFGDFIKAVVDIENETISLDSELHSDLEGLMLENGSEQINLWGVNYYHAQYNKDFIEFDSMINIKPNQDNFSRDVESESVRNKITKISYYWIIENNE